MYIIKTVLALAALLPKPVNGHGKRKASSPGVGRASYPTGDFTDGGDTTVWGFAGGAHCEGARNHPRAEWAWGAGAAKDPARARLFKSAPSPQACSLTQLLQTAPATNPIAKPWRTFPELHPHLPFHSRGATCTACQASPRAAQ
ncbi:hypothetical protein BCR34DRAFT_211173 [Clohesyomyces aquaticus]|uniref:Uncharacterized protein n=1 Tax=Clohesyomyces aquaticus TaxID=1231657 RepID=A0A1Y1ZWX7_9PLEO|nr:hypothetical protein BCR34DRAFT_211173 [Clohesyomyces aquaticus]